MSAPAATNRPASGRNLREAVGRTLRDPVFWGNYTVLFGLAAVVVVFSVLSPDFLTGANISDLLVAAALLVVLAIGQQLVLVVAGIDLSIAANLPWGAALLGWAVAIQHWSLAAGIALALVGTTLVGFVNGTIIAKVGINDFIVTLGTLGVMSGLALILLSGNSVSVTSTFMQGLALNSLWFVRWFVVIAAAVAIAAHVLLFHTAFGTHLLATGGNRDAARNMGIRVDRVRIAAYTIDGLLVGIAAVLLVAETGGADPTLQTNQLLSSIAAVVLGGSSLFGGKASVIGTVAGALLLTSLINGFTLLSVSPYYQPLAVGLVVVGSAALSRFQQ
jgi:ribose/xylose/arabinose/galactoside ABC-type transport system permease subunit